MVMGMAINNPNIISCDKHLYSINNVYTIHHDTLASKMRQAYEKGRSDSEEKGFGKAWSFLLSSSLTLFITVITYAVTSDWSKTSTFWVTFGFVAAFTACLSCGIASLLVSKNNSKNSHNLRDKAVEEIINGIEVRGKK